MVDKVMSAAASNLDLARLDYVKRVIAEFGDKIAPEVQRDILAQKVTIGMPPYEAYLAAGHCALEVIADSTRWPKNADPYKVVQAQTLHPDDSQIWMTFENGTQFPEKGRMRFRVFVKGGKVLSVEVVEPRA